MSAKFTIFKSGEQVHFTLFAPNHEKILTSERYIAKGGATNGIASVKANAPHDARFERRTSKSNQPYFVLKAGNGEIIGTSEMYSPIAACENGIASVKANAPIAEIVDQA